MGPGTWTTQSLSLPSVYRFEREKEKMKFTLEHRFAISRQLYLDEVYFHPELTKELEEAADLASKDMVEEEITDEYIRRVHFTKPRKDLPSAIKRVLGNRGMGFHETTIYYKNDYRLEWHMKTEVMPDRIYGGGEILFLEDGDHMIRRVHGELTAKVFGVGGLIEKVSVEGVKDSYDKVAEVTNAWIAKHHKS